MDIKDLQCFLAVAETLNFTRAAERIFISQSSLSLRISSLEYELGVKLFLRDSRHTFLSPAGAALLPHAKMILDELDTLPNLLKNVSENPDEKGSLVIAVDPDEDHLSKLSINDVIFDFDQSHPNIAVTMTSANPNTYLQDLHTRKVDLLLFRATSSDYLPPNFAAINLFTEEQVLVAHASLKGLSLSEVLTTKTIVLLRNSTFGDTWNEGLLNKLRDMISTPTVQYVDTLAAQQLCLYSDNNCTVMPILLYQRLFASENNTFWRFDSPDYNTNLMLVWSLENLNPSIQLFTAKIEEYIETQSNNA